MSDSNVKNLQTTKKMLESQPEEVLVKRLHLLVLAHLNVHLEAQLQQLVSTQSHAVTSITIYPRRTGTGTDRSNNIDIR